MDSQDRWSDGALNRVVRVSVGANEVRAVVEDDFHHFRVGLAHDGARVRALWHEPLRFPFSLCPAAGARLEELAGAPLSAALTDVFRRADARQQCTHQFDLAALAIAAAARGASRRYDAHVPDAAEGRTCASLRRDGAPALRWEVENYAVAAPAPFAGLGLGRGFTDWVARHLDAETAEAALVLRRAVFITRGRRRRAELDKLPHAPASGGCWAHQPERNREALRCVGSARDFTARAGELTADDEDWLAFR